MSTRGGSVTLFFLAMAKCHALINYSRVREYDRLPTGEKIPFFRILFRARARVLLQFDFGLRRMPRYKSNIA